jgi:hypothetical protein
MRVSTGASRIVFILAHPAGHAKKHLAVSLKAKGKAVRHSCIVIDAGCASTPIKNQRRLAQVCKQKLII